MKGDFSRQRLDLQTTWRAMLMQQGRPILDSDWNRQVALTERRLSHLMYDMLGQSGTPMNDPGFGAEPLPGYALNLANAANPKASDRARLGHQALAFIRQYMPKSCSSEDAVPPFRLTLNLMPFAFLPDLKQSSRTLIHVPGLVNLTMTTEGVLTLTAAAAPAKNKDADGGTDGEKASVTGASLPLGYSQTLTLEWDGTAVVIDGTLISQSLKLPVTSSGNESPYFLLVGGAFNDKEGVTNGAALVLEGAYLLNEDLAGQPSLSLSECLLEKQITEDYEYFAAYLGFPVPPKPVAIDGSIGPGRLILEGREYGNDQSNLLSTQNNALKCPTATDTFQQGTSVLAYLQGNALITTAIVDPNLIDPALDSIDTVVAENNNWLVKTLRAENPEALLQKWQLLENGLQQRGTLKLRTTATSTAPVENGLFCLQIHHSGWAMHWPPSDAAQYSALPVAPREELHILVLEQRPPEVFHKNQAVQLYVCDKKTNAVVEVDGFPATRYISDISNDGMRLTLNQALNQPAEGQVLKLLSIGTAKWSTHNGSITYPIEQFSSTDEDDQEYTAQLAGPGYNGIHLRVNAIVERRNLALDKTNTPGPLYVVNEFLSDRLQLNLTSLDGLGDEDLAGPSYLVVWDGLSYKQGDPSLMLLDTQPQILADGIQAEFSDTFCYHSGDYWTCMLREHLEHGFEWPTENGAPKAVQPEGPEYALSPLAYWQEGFDEILVEDRRRFFRPLTDDPFVDYTREDFRSLAWLTWAAEELGLPEWPEDPAILPDLGANLTRRYLSTVMEDKLRILVPEDTTPPEGLLPSHEQVTVQSSPMAPWLPHEVADVPDQMRSLGQAAYLGERPAYVCHDDNTIWVYNGPQSGWHYIAQFRDERKGYSVTWDDKGLYIVGGWHGSEWERHAKHVHRLDQYGSWHEVGKVPEFTAGPSTTIIGHYLLVAGGLQKNGSPHSFLGRLNLRNKDWSIDRFPMYWPAGQCANAQWQGRWFIFGGESREGHGRYHRTYDSTRVFDPATGRWEELTPMPKELKGHRAVTTPQGILVAGGIDSNDDVSRECFLYNPDYDYWLHVPDMIYPRAFFGLTTYKNIHGQEELLAIAGQGGNNRAITQTEHRRTKQGMSLYY